MTHSTTLTKRTGANGDRHYTVTLDGVILDTRTSKNRDYVAALIVRVNVARSITRAEANAVECGKEAAKYIRTIASGDTAPHSAADYEGWIVDLAQRAEGYRATAASAEVQLARGEENPSSVFSYHSRANLAKLPSYCRDGRLDVVAVALLA